LNIDRSGSTQSRGGVDNPRERGRKYSVVVNQKHIRDDIDISPGTSEGVGQDLTVVQDQGARVDVDVAATTDTAFYRRRDPRVRQLDLTRCIQRDVTSVGRNCPRGNAAVSHGDLIARGNLDVASQARTTQAIGAHQSTIDYVD